MLVEVKKYFMFYDYEYFRGDILRFKEEESPLHDFVIGRIYTEENVPLMNITKSFYNAHFKPVEDN